tara:strand:+ start:1391 stop:1654 length:264 start_codon:yes stop_codon:yes gene_type:complete
MTSKAGAEQSTAKKQSKLGIPNQFRSQLSKPTSPTEQTKKERSSCRLLKDGKEHQHQIAIHHANQAKSTMGSSEQQTDPDMAFGQHP